MDARDLMLGDWVRLCDSKVPLQMEDVSGTGMFKKWTPDGEYMIPFNYSEIEPIPLTPEILEKNGFVTAEKFRTYHYHHGGVYISVGLWGRITISSEGKRFGNRMNIDCQYIHELQHALRLCGIDKEIVL